MKSTKEFVDHIHDIQAKQAKNFRTQGAESPNSKLPNKQHPDPK